MHPARTADRRLSCVIANLDFHMDMEVNRDDHVSFLWRLTWLPNFIGTAAAFAPHLISNILIAQRRFIRRDLTGISPGGNEHVESTRRTQAGRSHEGG
jgi:hypothetical protein